MKFQQHISGNSNEIRWEYDSFLEGKARHVTPIQNWSSWAQEWQFHIATVHVVVKNGISHF